MLTKVTCWKRSQGSPREPWEGRERCDPPLLPVFPKGAHGARRSTPRVHRYMGGPMEQPEGASPLSTLVNRLYTLHLVTLATHQFRNICILLTGRLGHC